MAAYCLPMKCLHEIDSISSAFLWSGPDLNTRRAKIAWHDVCSSKNEGGLGIRNLKESAKVCYLKLIWRIISHQPSLWVSWVWESLIRASTFWSIRDTTLSGSWIWKQILKHRMEAKNLYRFKVGNGKSIYFWYDNWSDYGSLYDVFGSRGTIDLGIPKHYTLHQVFQDRRPRRNRNLLMNQVDNLIDELAATHLASRDTDMVQWKYSGTKYKDRFSSKHTWVLSRQHRLTLVWPKLIWFPHATPKFAFCTWLVFQDRLSTGDRMKQWNAAAHSGCVLCNQEEESRSHLFFECRFSRIVWRITIGSLLGEAYTSIWSQLEAALLGLLSSKIRFFLAGYAFQASIYHIWRERNGRIHGRPPIQARFLSRIIDKTVRNNINAIRALDVANYPSAMHTWLSTRLAY